MSFRASGLLALAVVMASPGEGQARPTGAPDHAAAASFTAGEVVRCNWRALGRWYPGRVGYIDRGYLFIHYDDGGREWISPRLCRRAVHAPPVPVSGRRALESHGGTGPPDEVEVKSFQRGDRVKCRWRGGKEAYAGRVSRRRRRAGMLEVEYDIGFSETISPTLCSQYASPTVKFAPKPGPWDRLQRQEGQVGLAITAVAGYDVSVEDAYSGAIPTTLVFTPAYYFNELISLELDIRVPLEVRSFSRNAGAAVAPGIGLTVGDRVKFRFGGKLYLEYQDQLDPELEPVDFGLHTDFGLQVEIVRWLGLYVRGGITGAFLRNVNFIFDSGGGAELRWM